MLDEIATGLQKLYLLSLDRTPAAELLTGTAQAWLEAITEGRSWEPARDTPRLRAAFVTLASTRESWPAPKHFLDALPRAEQRQLGYEIKRTSPEEATRRLAEIRTILDEPLPEFKAPPIPDGNTVVIQTKLEIEQGLKDHYTDRKTLAAGSDA